MSKPSLTVVQTIVGMTAGLISIVGAVYSGVQLFKPAPQFGDVVAVVRDARTDKPVTDATVEIFTREDALVTTVVSANKGQIRQTLREGPYRLRVSHPRFGAELRQIQVLPGQTSEVRVQLVPRLGGSSPVGEATRAVNEGVNAVHRFFRGLGL